MIRLATYFLLVLPCLALADDKTPKPKKPEGPLAEAKQRWLRGNNDEARAQYEKLFDDAKLRAAAAIGVARTWLSEGNHAKALAAIDAALKKDDKSADLLAFRGDVHYEAGRWDDALKDAEAAIKLNPDHFLARWVRAQHLRDSGDLTKADAEMRWFVRTYTRRDNEDKPITDPEELLLVGLAGAENARWHGLGDQFKFMINDLYPDVLKFDPDDWRRRVAHRLALARKVQQAAGARGLRERAQDQPQGRGGVRRQGRDRAAAVRDQGRRGLRRPGAED